MPPDARRRLKPFVPRLIGTNDGLDRKRAEVLRRALVETILPRVSGGRQAGSAGGVVEAARRARSGACGSGCSGAACCATSAGSCTKTKGRTAALAERAELASAAGHLLGLCARDAQDAREAEWYWSQAIGLLDRLCDVGAQGRRRDAASGVRAEGTRGGAAGGHPLERSPGRSNEVRAGPAIQRHTG